ncbi:hypothetical protein [Acidisoma sp. 7E03]
MSVSSQNPDAELIAACDEFLRRQRQFSAISAALPGDVREDDPAWAILDPIPELTERIVKLRASTPEGFFARAQCGAYFYLPGHRVSWDNPDASLDERCGAASMRDLIRLERGESA